MSKKKPSRICDPEVCCHCEYIGGGDMICAIDDSRVEIVVADWKPTDMYLWCERKVVNECPVSVSSR